MDAAKIIPSYEELPIGPSGLRYSWGVFGDNDELGTLNLLSDALVQRTAVAEVRTGERIPVTLPVTIPDPSLGLVRGVVRHTILRIGDDVQDDVLDNFFLQGSSQWDGLRHRRDVTMGFYGGVTEEEAGPLGDRLGIDAWARQGIIGRGVLVDVAAYMAATNVQFDPLARETIGVDLLKSTLAHQGTELNDGDILLVRTGFVGAYLRCSTPERWALRESGISPGLDASEEMAAFLWNQHCAAVAVDNPGCEVFPRDPTHPFLHARLIPMLGVVIGELFDLEELSRVCLADGRFTCQFVAVPLNMPGGVGSPANAVVVR